MHQVVFSCVDTIDITIIISKGFNKESGDGNVDVFIADISGLDASFSTGTRTLLLCHPLSQQKASCKC